MNLVTSNWIRTTNTGIVSMRDVFTGPDKIKMLCGLTPQETGGIYRLLTAVILDACGNEFVPSVVMEYLDEHIERFDLYSDDKPFYQSAQVKSGTFCISRIAPEYPGATSPILHTHQHYGGVFLCSRCIAGLLVALPAFANPGGRGYGVGANSGSPLYFIPEGETLMDTLSVCAAAFDRVSGVPAWRDSDTERGRIFNELSTMQALTFQPRKSKIISGEGTCSRCGEAGVGASRMHLLDGHKAQFVQPGEKKIDPALVWRDPMCAQKRNGPLSAHRGDSLAGKIQRAMESKADPAAAPRIAETAKSAGIDTAWAIGSANAGGQDKMIEWYTERISLDVFTNSHD